MTSNHKVDWLSISLPYNSIVSRDFDAGRLAIRPGIRDQHPELTDWLHSFPDWKEGGGNRIFNRSAYSQIGGYHIFWNSNKNFSLIEIEGTGVQNLRQDKLLKRIIKNYGQYLTRIDIATDWETDVSPREFSDYREANRFKAHTEITSDTGETCYVGSKESDRYARTYRYSEPHPRHKLLRCEFVLRDGNAKQFATMLQTERLSSLTGKLFRTFGFCHRLIIDHKQSEALRSAPRAGNMGSTERWLFTQVLPACKKMIDAGKGEYVDLFGKQLYTYYTDRLIQEENRNGKEALLPDIELLRE